MFSFLDHVFEIWTVHDPGLMCGLICSGRMSGTGVRAYRQGAPRNRFRAPKGHGPTDRG